MITKLSHTSFFVLDQDKAYEFYVNKLGFKVHTDVKMDNGFRWLTVTAPDQPDLEIVLFPATNNGFDDETNKALKLPFPKLLAPFLWMISKKSVGLSWTGFENNCNR